MQKPEIKEKVENFAIDQEKKVNVLTTPIMEGGIIKIQEIKTVRMYSQLEKRYKIFKRITRILPLNVAKPELKKEASIDVLIRRTGLDSIQIQNVYGWFKSKVTAKIPSDMRNHYLTISDNRIYLHDWNSFLFINTQILSATDERFCTMSKPKRIENAEAIKLINADALILEETSPRNYRIRC